MGRTVLVDLRKNKSHNYISGVQKKVKVVGMNAYYAELYNQLSAQERADNFNTMARRHRYGDIRELLK